MSQRSEIVRIESEIGEALPKATGETATILADGKRDLARIIGRLPKGTELLSLEQISKAADVAERLGRIPAPDPLKITAFGWIADLNLLMLPPT